MGNQPLGGSITAEFLGATLAEGNPEILDKLGVTPTVAGNKPQQP